MQRQTLWLLVGQLENPDISYAAATTAWIAKQKGVLFECYLECFRNGKLFAQTGSTVIGGHHHQQLNYLLARTDIKLLILGESNVFASTFDALDCEKIVCEQTLKMYYEKLLAYAKVMPDMILFAPNTIAMKAADGSSTILDISPYYHSEIFFSKALAFSTTNALDDTLYAGIPRHTLWYPESTRYPSIDSILPGDDYGTMTLRLANRWTSRAKGVAFGDPDAIRSQIPSLCADERVSVYAPTLWKEQRDTVFSSYAESTSAIAAETAGLARKLGNPILVGRQTCDGDLFLWGSKGVSIQIMDPNRPAFPIVAKLPQKWHRVGGSLWEDEPDDATLEKWASKGKVLTSILFHSGEMAHNEAILQLIDYCSFTGFKLGVGAHLKRYETCPQMWELINTPRNRGGARGLVEPLLHSGGLGIMAEKDCPPEAFKTHCQQALNGIRAIAGDEATPRGYYFFCDTDLHTLQNTTPALYGVLHELGMEYAISNAWPGKNRILDNRLPVLTQTSRTICGGSPFVRITSREDIFESGFQSAPGWFIGVLDAPVIAFSPYIWQEGNRFVALTQALQSKNMINVLPETIARYAKILQKRGDIPS